MLNRRSHDLHDQGVTTCYTITFEHLWNFLSRSGQTCASLSRGVIDTNNSGDWISNPSRIYLRPIASNNACIFHSPHALSDCGRRESNSLSKLTKREPGILL